ncbi:hypothetical protein GCM10011354_27810 [Egicoccus halophilus]|uniref:Sodium/hydrogen exchanger family protein n=1 Tax=Egicoccus halophilus TaxID=1670830 RepID=A0A8J3AA33_9ACTN|nr:hypothetical protein GCM10011354_27810 [Egicoccus halophilus]
MVLVGVSLVVARPLAGWIGLLGFRGGTRAENAVIAFFGIKGLGSLYYLAYGLNRTDLGEEGYLLWALTAVTIFTSLLVHGFTARPAMRWLDGRRAVDGQADPRAWTDTA